MCFSHLNQFLDDITPADEWISIRKGAGMGLRYDKRVFPFLGLPHCSGGYGPYIQKPVLPTLFLIELRNRGRVCKNTRMICKELPWIALSVDQSRAEEKIQVG